MDYELAKLIQEVEEYTTAAHKIESFYVEIMAAAYYTYTKLPPDRVQLVRKMDVDKLVFFYEERVK